MVLKTTVRHSKQIIHRQISIIYTIIILKSCVIAVRGTTGIRRDSAWWEASEAASPSGAPGTRHPANRLARVSHIEHKLSISSGAGVTIARARIDTSFNGLVGRVRPSASAAGSVAPPSPASRTTRSVSYRRGTGSATWAVGTDLVSAACKRPSERARVMMWRR